MEELRTIGVFRCTEKKYADSFRNSGNIKLNTPQYWIDLEKKEGKGRGDSTEGVFAAINKSGYGNIIECYKLRENVKGETPNDMTYLRSEDSLNLPCYCLFGLNNTTFSEVSVDEKGIEHRVARVTKQYFKDFSENITKEVIHNLPEGERPVLVMITNPHEFFKRVRNYFEEFGVKHEEILISPVEYMDKNKEFICNRNSPYELFLKDKSFLHQSEIRIILNTKNQKILRELEEKNYIVDIGDLSDITHIENFYFDDMLIEIQDDNLVYTLSEPIITALEDLPKEILLCCSYQIGKGEAPGVDTEEDIIEQQKAIDDALRKVYNTSIEDYPGIPNHINKEY